MSHLQGDCEAGGNNCHSSGDESLFEVIDKNVLDSLSNQLETDEMYSFIPSIVVGKNVTLDVDGNEKKQPSKSSKTLTYRKNFNISATQPKNLNYEEITCPSEDSSVVDDLFWDSSSDEDVYVESNREASWLSIVSDHDNFTIDDVSVTEELNSEVSILQKMRCNEAESTYQESFSGIDDSEAEDLSEEEKSHSTCTCSEDSSAAEGVLWERRSEEKKREQSWLPIMSDYDNSTIYKVPVIVELINQVPMSQKIRCHEVESTYKKRFFGSDDSEDEDLFEEDTDSEESSEDNETDEEYRLEMTYKIDKYFSTIQDEYIKQQRYSERKEDDLEMKFPLIGDEHFFKIQTTLPKIERNNETGDNKSQLILKNFSKFESCDDDNLKQEYLKIKNEFSRLQEKYSETTHLLTETTREKEDLKKQNLDLQSEINDLRKYKEESQQYKIKLDQMQINESIYLDCIKNLQEAKATFFS